jgi:predicted KAP-like P-loop ATPase
MITIFSDSPIPSIDKDGFGLVPHVRALKDIIEQATSLPLCVGIFGPWGSGKTSFMKMLQALIDEQANKESGSIEGKQIIQEAEQVKVQTIWFNPWKYDKKEDVWNALIQTILTYIAAKSRKKEVVEKAKNLAKNLAWPAVSLALKKAITAFTAGVISEDNLDNLLEIVSKGDELYCRHINQFEEDFARVVKLYLPEGGRLVVFIDDLDRCLPENAITVLESLKLFIGDANCIFVLGMDHDIVENGIQVRYGEKINIDGREYLDKIIQVPFYLPPVTFKRLKTSLEADGETLSEDVWNVIRLGMGSNPRKTKRFVNSFYLSQLFLNAPGQNLQEKLQNGSLSHISPERQNFYLAKILVFQMRFPEFYQYLWHHPDEWRYLEEYVILQNDSEKGKEKLRDKTELTRFWENASFRDFMSKTSKRSFQNYPPAPSSDLVEALLGAISLVTETTS